MFRMYWSICELCETTLLVRKLCVPSISRSYTHSSSGSTGSIDSMRSHAMSPSARAQRGVRRRVTPFRRRRYAQCR